MCYTVSIYPFSLAPYSSRFTAISVIQKQVISNGVESYVWVSLSLGIGFMLHVTSSLEYSSLVLSVNVVPNFYCYTKGEELLCMQMLHDNFILLLCRYLEGFFPFKNCFWVPTFWDNRIRACFGIPRWRFYSETNWGYWLRSKSLCPPRSGYC